MRGAKRLRKSSDDHFIIDGLMLIFWSKGPCWGGLFDASRFLRQVNKHHTTGTERAEYYDSSDDEGTGQKLICLRCDYDHTWIKSVIKSIISDSSRIYLDHTWISDNWYVIFDQLIWIKFDFVVWNQAFICIKFWLLSPEIKFSRDVKLAWDSSKIKNKI